MAVYLLIACTLTLWGCSDQEGTREILAEVGDASITRQDLETFWETLDPQTRGKGAQWLLETLITREILLREASQLGLEASTAVQAALGSAVDRRLTDELFERKVASRVEVSEQDLVDIRDYMDRHGIAGMTEMRIGHLAVATEEEAQEIILAYRDGADFFALARQHAVDPDMVERSGDLGFWPDGRTGGPAVDIAASLETGEISEPVADDKGRRHLVAVLSRRPLDYLDTATQQSQMENRVRATKTRQARERYMDYLSEQYQLEIDQETLSLLLQRGWRCIDGIPVLDTNELDKPLLTYRDGQVTLRTHVQWLEELRPAHRRPSTVDSSQVMYFATRRTITERLYPAEARALNLQDNPDIQRYAGRRKADLMIQELRRIVVEEPLLSAANVTAYYQRNPDRFIAPERTFVEALTVADSLLARQALIEGPDMGLLTLARQFDQQGNSGQHLVFSCTTGETVTGTAAALCTHALATAPGSWAGPVEVPPRRRRDPVRYAVLHVLDRHPRRRRDLDEPDVRQEVQEALLQMHQNELDKRFDDYIAELRATHRDQVVRYYTP